MNSLNEEWRLNLPQILTLPDFGLDDVDADSYGNVYVSDSVNSCVYKFAPSGMPLGSFPVNYPSFSANEGFLMNLAVDGNANFLISDGHNGLVLKYDGYGNLLDQYWTPGVLTICAESTGKVYALTNSGGIERIECYSEDGTLADILPAPQRNRSQSDPSLLNLDVDAQGNVYMSEGTPPYRIWRIRADGSQIETLERYIDFPEDAILIADIGVDRATGNVYSLLACKEAGQQIVDCFSPDGEYLGMLGVPHSETMYSVMCVSPDSGLYLLDTSTGPGGGDLMRTSREKPQF
ncbi:MAG TPA: hypothetical protein VGK34_02240 [Armatimonadota bacterium]